MISTRSPEPEFITGVLSVTAHSSLASIVELHGQKDKGQMPYGLTTPRKASRRLEGLDQVREKVIEGVSERDEGNGLALRMAWTDPTSDRLGRRNRTNFAVA